MVRHNHNYHRYHFFHRFTHVFSRSLNIRRLKHNLLWTYHASKYVNHRTEGTACTTATSTSDFVGEAADAATEDVPLQEHEIVQKRFCRQVGNAGAGQEKRPVYRFTLSYIGVLGVHVQDRGNLGNMIQESRNCTPEI